MIISTPAFRRMCTTFAIAIFAFALAGCPGRDSSPGGTSGGGAKKLDGVYHGAPGSPITLTIKGGKAIMTVGTESKTLDYKVEGNKLTILNPQEGDAVFTINDDGTLNSELGVLTKSPS